jgi:lysozyme family protein
VHQSESQQLQRQLQQFHRLQQQQQQYEQLEQQPQLGLIEPLPSTVLALELELTELMHLQQQLTAELAAVPAGSPLAHATQAVLDVHSAVLLRALAIKAAIEEAVAAKQAPDMLAWPLLQADETGTGLLELLPAI